MIRLMGGLMVFVLSMPVATALTPSYVTNPASCPSSHSQFPGQNCSGGLNICGVDTSTPTEVTQCYDNSTISAPGGSATSNTLYTGSLGGGYILDCFAQVDSSAPYCDNNGAWLCNRSSTCYTTKQRDTTCTAPGVSSCGACRSGYQDCGGDDACEVQTGTTNYPTGANNNYAGSCGVQCDSGYLDCDASGAGSGNGCEIQVGGACTTGDGAAGTYSGCTCVPTKSYFQTGTRSTYSTSNPLLWGRQLHGTGQLISFANKVGEMFAVYNSGAVKIGNFTAGTGTGAGTIRWTGADFEGYDGTSWISMTGGSAGGLTILSGDARYVRKAGDTMTGSLIVQATMSGRHLIVSQTASFSGALIAAGNATVRGTLSGSRLVVSGHTNISGTLLVLNGITSRRTISGANLYAAASISGAHLYSATTFGGAGLASCNGAAQKLMYNATTKRFECGTDLNTGGGSVSTGSVLLIGDARYVRKSGDTMTGALVINVTGGSMNTLGLRVINTISGAVLHAEKLLTSSGMIVGESGALLDGGTLYVDAGNNRVGVGTTAPAAPLHIVGSSEVLRVQGSGADVYMRLKNTAFNGREYTLASAAEGSALPEGFNIFDITAGQSRLYVASGGNIGIGTGFGRPSDRLTVFNSIADTTQLRVGFSDSFYWKMGRDNITTGRFSIQDQTGEKFTILNSGNVGIGTIAPKARLDVLGTISGSRLSISNNANISGALLVVRDLTTRGTLSGYNLTVSRSASISGTLIVKTGITSKGSVSGSTIDGFGLGSCNGAAQKLLYNATTDKFECGTITAAGTFSTGNVLTIGDARYVRKSGDTMTGSLNVRATLSGSRLVVDSNANISGALLVKGNVGIGTTVPKAKLDVLGSISGTSLTLSNLRNCDTIDTDSSGNLICGSDQSAGSGLDQNTADARYVRKSGDTMTGALVIDITGGNPLSLGLNVRNTISGSRLIVSGNASVSGALLVKNNITTRGTLSGYNLTVSRSASISGTLIVKTGITSKGSVSGSTIDGFGLGSCNGASQKLLYNATTDKFECGTITASAGTFSTGNVLTIGDARYVRKSGDTMTGALIVQATMSGRHLIVSQTASFSGAIIAASNATVRGTLSGSRLVVSGHTNISGTLLVLNTITSKSTISGSNLFASKSITGTHLYAVQTFGGAGLADCDAAGTSKLLWDSTTKRFSCGTDQDTNTTYTAGQGLTLNGTSFRLSDAFSGTSLAIYGTMSGSRLIVSGHANISGSLLVKNNITTRGTLSGYNLTVSRSASISGTLIVKTGITSKGSLSGSTIDGFGLGSCNGAAQRLLYNATTDKFECGTIAAAGTFSTGNVLTIGDARYVRKSGDTMTGSLNVRATLSGSRLVVDSNANISGALLVKGNVGIGTSAAATKLYVLDASKTATTVNTNVIASFRSNANGADTAIQFSDNTANASYIGMIGGDLYMSPASSEALRVTTIGRVGIGTTAPKTKLDVLGSISGTSLTLSNLRNCDTIDTDSSGNLICGSDQSAGSGLDQNTADARYVRKSGDTMTGALVIDITGGNPLSLGLNVRNTISGSRLIVSGNASVSGALLVKNNITTRGTLSGYNLTVSRSASISGTLIVRTGITSKGSVSGSTIDGFGLGSCNGASQRLLYNATTDKFECGTITAAGTFSTGNVLTIGDARYVRKSGDTMTGQLIVDITGGNVNTVGLKVVNTLSGAHLHAEKTLSASGALIVESAVGFRLYDTVNDLGITSNRGGANQISIHDNTTDVFLYDGATGNVSIATLANGNITLTPAGAGNVGIATSAPKAKLDVLGTISGSRLSISNNANISGALLVVRDLTTRGTLSGYNLTVSRSASISGTLIVRTGITSKGSVSGSTIDGFGLGACTGTFQKLMYNATTDKFECGTIATSSTFGTGNVLTIGDARYVRKAGDTMTGALIVDITGGNPQTLGLNVRNTISGSRLIISGHASISGALIVRNNIFTSGTLSGRNLTLSNSASISGTLIVRTGITSKGSVSGSTIDGFGLGACNGASQRLLYNSTTDKFECGMITSGGGGFGTGNVLAIGDARYVHQSGDTMTGTLIIQNGNASTSTNTPLLNVRGTLSGRSLLLSGTGGSATPLFFANQRTDTVSIGSRNISDAGQLYIEGKRPKFLSRSSSNGNGINDEMVIDGNTMYIPVFDSRVDIVDISNPRSFTTLSEISVTGVGAVDAQGHYLYIGGNGALFIADVSNKSAPVVVSRAKLGITGRVRSVSVDGRYAYITVESSNVFRVIDISNPYNPVAVASISTGILPTDMALQDDYAYVINQTSATMQVIRVTDPANPLVVGSVATGTAPLSIEVQGRYAYITNYSSGTMQVIDIKNPASPASVATVSSLSTARSISIAGRTAYVIGDSAMYVIDISTPTSPVLRDTVSGAGGDMLIANGRYLYVSFYISDDGQYTNTYDIGGAYIQSVEAGDIVASSLSVSQTLSTVGLRVRNGLYIGNHLYVGGDTAMSGSLKIVGGYNSGSGNILFSSSGATTFNVNARNVDFRIKSVSDADTFVVDASTGNVGIGVAGPEVKLEVLGTLSGSNLTVSRSASISGTLIVKTGITSKGSVSGSTIDGFGLGSCNGGSQRLLYNATTDKFECGTISASSAFGTGNVLTIGDARYLRRSGGTMTGQLVVDITGGNSSTLGLDVKNTISGSRLTVSGHTNISGSLLVKNSITSKGSLSGVTIAGFNLGSCNSTSQKLLYNYATQKFECGVDRSGTNTGNVLTIGDARYVRKSGDTMTGALIVQATMSGRHLIVSQTASFSGAIIAASNATVRGTLSGSRLVVSGHTNISGSLLVLNNITSRRTISGSNLYAAASISGSHLYIANTIGGAGLGSCNSANSRLLYNSTTKKFECGTISAAGTFSTGNVLTIGDARYVNQSGDTMTGALSVRAALSGAYLVISGNANVSGALLVKNNITTRGTLSGYNLTVSRSASISGTLIVKTGITSKGSVSGSTIDGFGLGSCNGATQKLLYNASTDQFECGTIASGGSGFSTGNVLTIGDARYVRKSGGTMTGQLVVDITGGNSSTLGLDVKNTISGSRLIVSGHTNISGSLLVKNNITTRGTLSGYNLTVSRSASISGTLIVKTGITSKGSVSGSTIDGFGLGSCNGSSQKLLYNSSTDKFECGTISAGGSFSTGAVLKIGDARYVRKAGDTMTGTLTINMNNGTLNSIGLKVINTFSGALIHAEKLLSIGGTQSGNLLTITALTASGAQKSTLFSVDQMGLSQLQGGAYFGRVGLTENQWALTTTGALWVSRDSSRLWTSVAMSSDGKYQTAVLNFGNIYTSSDHGVTWAAKGTMQAYVDVAMSADGKMQTVVESGGPIFTSHDYGQTWTSRASAEAWNTISMSADGKIQTATIDGCGAGGYTSRDFGVTWPTVDGLCVSSDIKDSAMSSDGKIQVMVDSSAVLQSHIISTNYGMTWTSSNDEIPRSIIAISGDGRIQTSGSNGGALRTSYDYGRTWAVRTPARAWRSVAMSSDGRNQVAVVDSGKIYTSSDYGVTWTAQESNRAWRAVAMSSDGKAMTAVGSSTNIYTGHATSYQYGKIGIGTSAPIAMLSVDATSNAALSLNSATSDRLKPSILYGYQGNFDVAVWRSSGSVLNQSGSHIIHGGTGRTLLTLLSQASSAQTNVFKINSQVNTGLGTTKNNLVFRITASGAVYSDGRYNSAGADYAEWFKTTDKDLGPGELVCVDVFQNNTVRRCTRSGDPNLMGIVSTNPSFVGNYIGGADGIIPPGYVLVGLIGQVPTKAMIEENETIRPGDSLTSAGIAGMARKAKAGESTVGVALEGYDGTGNNVINVLISRRNQSLTVESVEQKVLDSIASMNLSDEIRQMVQSVSQNLNLDDRVTTALNSRLASIDLSEQINTAIDARLSGALLATNDVNSIAAAAVAIMRSDTGSMVDMTARSLIADIQSDLLAVKSAFSGGVLNINSLHLAANATLEGSLTVAGTVALTSSSLKLGPISVSGSAVSIGSLVSSGSLVVMGPITVQGLAEFFGDVHIKGELRVSNRQAGFAAIPKTGTSVTVRWDPPMSALPIVTATPDVPVLFAVTKVTATGFTIRIAGIAEEKITFSFIALSADAPQTVLGYGQETPVALIPFIVNELGQPVSSDAVWNGCIQSRPVLDSEGHPMSCARYHDGFVWEHPDLGIFFTYNPNHEPSILIVPEGYVVTPSATSSSAVSSSESSSSSSESSEGSSSSSSESSVSSSESSSASSESSSSEASEPEPVAPVEPPIETPPPTESADPAPAPTE